jgi:hypothetical protein
VSPAICPAARARPCGSSITDIPEHDPAGHRGHRRIGARDRVGALIFGSDDTHASSTATSASAPAGTAPDTRAITLPNDLGGLRDIGDVIKTKTHDAKIVKQQTNNVATVGAATEAAYRKAFGGPATAFRQYADSGLEHMPYVIAVRAPAPGLTIGPVQNAKFLGLATPEREVKSVGPVSCQIEWSPPTPAGRTPPPSSELVVACQRSGPHVTVYVVGGQFTGPSGLQASADFTNAAFTAAGGR